MANLGFVLGEFYVAANDSRAKDDRDAFIIRGEIRNRREASRLSAKELAERKTVPLCVANAF